MSARTSNSRFFFFFDGTYPFVFFLSSIHIRCKVRERPALLLNELAFRMRLAVTNTQWNLKMMEKTRQQQQRQQRKINVPRKHLRLIILWHGWLCAYVCMKCFIGCSAVTTATSFSILLPFYVMALCGGFIPLSLYMAWFDLIGLRARWKAQPSRLQCYMPLYNRL